MPVWRYKLDDIHAKQQTMPSVMNGFDGSDNMKYAELPGIFEDSQNVESDWYTLAVYPSESSLIQAVTLLAFNRCDAVKDLWEVVRTTYPEPDYQVIAARRFREAMMKVSILVGFPKVHSTQTRLISGHQRSSGSTKLFHR